MKTIIAVLFLLFFPITSYAGDLFFQPFDATDWTLLAGTGLSDFGDYQTSVAIPSQAEHGYPGYVEGNPLMLHLFGTNLPSQPEYTAWFGGEILIQSAAAYALPPQWREAFMGAFIGIGSVDVANNQLVHTYYMGNSLTVPFPDGNSRFFSHDAFNATDWTLWSGFVASQGLLLQHSLSNPNLNGIRSGVILSTAETVGVVSLIAAILPQRWRDALFGYEMGMAGTQMTIFTSFSSHR